MPLNSNNFESTALKTRVGHHQPSNSAAGLMKSSSSPELISKSVSRDAVLLQASHYKDRPSKSDDDESISYTSSRSFEFREDPDFWKEHSVQVIIRTRPLSNSELSLQGNNRCVKQESSQSIAWTGHPESRFTFDYVADETVSQEMLFKVAGVPMVENCMEGYNSCMFAYGQTGSGKTHTMLGDIEGGVRRHSVNCGMIPRIFEYLFSRIQKDKDIRREEKLKFTCKCSFLEIYNEQIIDLLDPSSINLQIREDNKKGVYVENLNEVEVTSAREVVQQLIQGAANRKVAATNMNIASSRSHSVFTCVTESKWESQGVTHHRFARLNLVDLAGSERQKSSGAEGERLKEATNINKSLSTLGLVIMNLVSISNGKSVHIPYRDSKLTFLLQDSLGGNAKTIIIANISPSNSCSLETLSTLKFAQRAKFIKNHAIVNEDASGNVLALRVENQNLKNEVSHLRSLLHGGSEIYGDGVLSAKFSESPGPFKWDGLHGLSSPLISEKKMSHLNKKEYEVALVGAFRREKDKEISLQELSAENQAALLLVKQREDEIQGLKMRLRFREAGIKRLEAVASGKISAETHLLKEKEENLREIEVLRSQVDRNQEATKFAMENLRLKEEIRRLKSFVEEGERERMNEQIGILESKLLEALDWKLMHESDPTSTQEFTSPWCSSTNEESEFLRLQAIQNQSELDSLHKKLDFCVGEKEKLERQVEDLAKELDAQRLSGEFVAEQSQKGQAEIPFLINDHVPMVEQSDPLELKTMIDAIAAASHREAEAHETSILLSKEIDELRMKLKVLIEDNNKLIDLYESAVAENRKSSDDSIKPQENRTEDDQDHNQELSRVTEQKELEMKRELASLQNQLSEMHEENDKLLCLYENAMQERDEYKRVFASSDRCKRADDDKRDICSEKLVKIDQNQNIRFDDSSTDAKISFCSESNGVVDCCSIAETGKNDEFKLVEQEIMEIDALGVLTEPEESNMLHLNEGMMDLEVEEKRPSMICADVIRDLNLIRKKLVEVQEKLSHSAEIAGMLGSLERAIIDVEELTEKIRELEISFQGKQQECASHKLLYLELLERKDLANKKLSALKHSLITFSSSIGYFEQREALTRSKLNTSSQHLTEKKEGLARIQVSRDEFMNTMSKIEQSEAVLKSSLINFKSKMEEEDQKLENERVLLSIDNIGNASDSSKKNWQFTGKATDLLKSEEEKTNLQNQIKLHKEKLRGLRKEAEIVAGKLDKANNVIHVLELEVRKENLHVEELNHKLENIIEEKEMILEVQDNGMKEFESMVLEFYQCLFEADLKDGDIKIMEDELKVESKKMEALQKEKSEATLRKKQLLEAMLINSFGAAETIEADIQYAQLTVVELKSLLDDVNQPTTFL